MRLPKLALNLKPSKDSGNTGNTGHSQVSRGLRALPVARNGWPQVATSKASTPDPEKMLPVMPVEKTEWQQLQPTEYGLVASVASVTTPKQSTELTWVDGLAALLQCEPSYLLECCFIDQHDLVEQDGSDLPATARLIRSTWCEPAQESVRHTPDLLTVQGQAYWVGTDPQYLVVTAATASPAWVAARNQYIQHIMACDGCYAPTGRYCNIGADLKAIYEEASEELFTLPPVRASTALAVPSLPLRSMRLFGCKRSSRTG